MAADDGDRLCQVVYNINKPAEVAAVNALKAVKAGDKQSALHHLEDASNTISIEMEENPHG